MVLLEALRYRTLCTSGLPDDVMMSWPNVYEETELDNQNSRDSNQILLNYTDRQVYTHRELRTGGKSAIYEKTTIDSRLS